MDLTLEMAREICEVGNDRPCVAFRRLSEAVLAAEYPLPLSDLDLAAGAREAVRRGESATALVALEELELRLVADVPVEHLMGREAA